MQVQDYLPFFQDLMLHYYQFTLENPVYAICLAVAVWLLTAIFYSLRIGFLNRRNRINLKVRLDAQNAVAAAQQQIQQLQEEITASKEQIEQEAQRSAALRERIAGLGSQLAESIVALAADPELGQQGLSVSDGLEAEHLWQRYSAAVKQLGESLVAERKTNNELQQACSAETAKLAEKNQELQATQTRFDFQKQQLTKLELAVEEHKTQLAQQQEVAQQSLANIEAKHKIDLARLVVLEQQALEWTQAKHQQSQLQEKLRNQDSLIARLEQAKPVETRAMQAAIEPDVKVAAPEPAIAIAETPKQQPAKAAEETGGVTGKFKSLFAGAKQQMEKLDDLFGLNTPLLQPEEPSRTVQAEREPQAVAAETQVSESAEAVAAEQQSVSAVKIPSDLTGKLKNLFGSFKEASTEAAPTIEEKPVEAIAAEPEQQPAETSGGDVGAGTGTTSGKLKNLFGKFKRTA